MVNRLFKEEDSKDEPEEFDGDLPMKILRLVDAEIAEHPQCTFSHLIGCLEQAKAQVIVSWRKNAGIEEE
jgi:hypothetical protein